MSETINLFLDGSAAERKTSLEEFFESAGVAPSWVESLEDADVVIDCPDERGVCEPDLLHCGGRMSCPNAFAAAARLRISRADMGRLLNLLEVKIGNCQLGCFP